MFVFWIIRKSLKLLFWLLLGWSAFAFYNVKEGRVVHEEMVENGGRAVVRVLPSTLANAIFWYRADEKPVYRFEYYRPGRHALESACSRQRKGAPAVTSRKEANGSITFLLDGKPACSLTHERLWSYAKEER